MASSSATTRAVAYNTVISSRMTKITTLEYQQHDVKQLHKEILASSLVVSSTYGGGRHGNAFLIFDDDGYKEYTGSNTTKIDKPHPSTTPNIVGGDVSAS